MPLAEQILAGELAVLVTVRENRVAPGGLIVAEPDHRNVVDLLQNFDRPVLPGDADDAVEPAVGQIADPVFGDHGDSGVHAGERVADVLRQRIDVAAHDRPVRRLGDDRDLLAAHADAGAEAEFARRGKHPAARFGRNQRTVIEYAAHRPGGNPRSRCHLRQHAGGRCTVFYSRFSSHIKNPFML